MSSQDVVAVHGRAVSAFVFHTTRIIVAATVARKFGSRAAYMWSLVEWVTNKPDSVVEIMHVLVQRYSNRSLQERNAGRDLFTGLMLKCPVAVRFAAAEVLRHFLKLQSQYSWIWASMLAALREVGCRDEFRDLVTAIFFSAGALGQNRVNLFLVSNLDENFFLRECVYVEEVAAVLLSKKECLTDNCQAAALRPLGQLLKRCPANAAHIADTMLAACDSVSSSQTKGTAITQLSRVMRACPEKALKCATVLLHACSEEEKYVREAALEQLAACFELAPAYADSFVRALTLACGDNDPHVRRMAMRLSPEAAILYPAGAEELFAKFITNASGTDFTLLLQEENALRQAFVAWTDHASELADLVIGYWPIECPPMNRLAIMSIAAAIKACPQKEEGLIKTLRAACDSSFPKLRALGASELVSVAKACLHRTAELIDVLLHLSTDTDHYVKRKAVPQLPKAAKLWPEKAKILVEEVLNCCYAKDLSLKVLGVGSIAESIEACPELAQPFLAALFDACDNKDRDVCSTALRQIGAIGRCLPEHAEDLVSVLLRSCCEGDESIRCTALSQLSDVAKISPSRSQEFIETLCSCVGELSYIDSEAREQLTGVLCTFPDLAIKAMEYTVGARGGSASILAGAMEGRRLKRAWSANDLTAVKRKYAEVDADAGGIMPQSDDRLLFPKRRHVGGYASA